MKVNTVKSSKREVGIWIVLLIPPVIALIVRAYIGSLSRFLADDYCVAYYAKHFGLLRSIWYWYITWSGGYSTSLVDWLLVIITAQGIPFVTPIILLIWLIVTTSAIYLWLPAEPSKIGLFAKSTTGALWLIFGVLLISPDVPQSLYWWTGMRAYTVPLIVLTFYMAVLAGFKRKGELSARWQIWILLSFSIIFINGGFSETLTPVQLVLFVAASALWLWSKKLDFHDRTFYFLLAGALGAFVSLAVMVASPGNSNRQAFYPPPPNLYTLSSIALKAFFLFLGEMLRTPEKLTGLIGLVLLSVWFGMHTKTKILDKTWIPPSIVASGLILAFGCFLPAAWGLSDAPPPRNLIIPAFLLIGNFLIAGFLVGNLISTKAGNEYLLVSRLGLLIVAIMLLGYSVWINTQDVYSARQAHIAYAQKWDAINQQIVNARISGNTVVHIPSMESWTTLNEPNNNPKFWLNICYSKYYGIQILSP